MKKSITYLLLCAAYYASAQISKAPEVKEGDGPYSQLIIRGVTLIDGTGAPPTGPVDIIVKQNRIERIVNVGFPTPETSPPYLKQV